MLNDYLLNECHFVRGKNNKWDKGLVCLLITFIDTTHFMPGKGLKVRFCVRKNPRRTKCCVDVN